MNPQLIDTNVASILFSPGHPLHAHCRRTVTGSYHLISFMTRAELMVWPIRNNWGVKRRLDLDVFIDDCTTIYPDEVTCQTWAEVNEQSRAVGRSMSGPDTWIAAVAQRWKMPLVTTDYRDFEHLPGLRIIAIP